VSLFVTERGDDEDSDPGLDFHIVPPYRARALGADLRMLLTNWRLLRALRGAFRRERPDAIYERYSLYAFAGARAAKEFGVPRILEINARLVEERRGRLHFPWLARRFENGLARRAGAVIVLTAPLKESFVSLGTPENKITVMPMAVDIRRFRPDVEPRRLREELGIQKRTIIGYLGTLTHWHGIEMLFTLARRFAQENVDGVFVVIGGDEAQVAERRRQVAESGLAEYLYFAGSVPYTAAPSYIQAMDIMVIANSTEFSSPTKLFEYQAMAKPAVAPDLPPIREAMTHGQEGLLFKPGDTGALGDAVLELIRDPEKGRRLGARARERVARCASWEVNARGIISLYEKLLDIHSSGA